MSAFRFKTVYGLVAVFAVGVVVAVGAGEPCATTKISQDNGGAPLGVQDKIAVFVVTFVAASKAKGGKHAAALQSTTPVYNVVPAEPVLAGFV